MERRTFVPMPCPALPAPVNYPPNNAWFAFNYVRNPQSLCLDDVVLVGAMFANSAFFLAHEAGHATGHWSRANRASLYHYLTSKTAHRIEETIADTIAMRLTGEIRAHSWWQPVLPGSRNWYYVQHKVQEAMQYLVCDPGSILGPI